ncbi:MAG TPA: hypothetical protein VL172_22750, partial [Kofleriaceae bacterium]|nr:hypothetical protein [Kofleriaceae bacterium]
MRPRRGCRGLSSAALIVQAACGEVTSAPDAGEPSADAAAPGADAEDPSADAAGLVADAGPDCVLDSFTGDALAPHWQLLVGSLPTAYAVAGSHLLISDAPFAATATPPVSWISELDTDQGNQLGWAQAIGDADFTVTADLGWSSTSAELTFAGVAVATAQGQMSALVGVRDGSVSLTGYPNAQFLAKDIEDPIYIGEREEPG